MREFTQREKNEIVSLKNINQVIVILALYKQWKKKVCGAQAKRRRKVRLKEEANTYKEAAERHL